MTVIPIQLHNNPEDSLFFDEKQTQEIVVSLFSECNMKCKFCFQKNIDIIRWSKENTDIRIRLFEKALPKIKRHNIKIKIAGGELFQDKLIERGALDDYQRFIDEYKALMDSYGKTYYFSITTNLVLSKHIDDAIKFVKKNNIEIVCSYDFDGRFTKESQIKNFLKNIDALDKNGITSKINFVVTNKALQMLIYDRDHELVKIFDSLYKTHPVTYEYYTNMEIKEYDLTEEELGNGLCALCDLYPKIENFEVVKNSLKTFPTCCQCIWIDTVLLMGCSDHKSNTIDFLSNKGCLSCDYYYRCPKSCPRIFHQNKECFVKMLYDHWK